MPRTTGTTTPPEWDTNLVRQYDVAGPRYTSYPTANLFHDNFTESDYLALASDADERISGNPLSLYVHIPFCRDICYYCACNKVVTRKPEQVVDYLDAMKQELTLRGALHGHRPVTQLHWGGGTPTYLNEAQLTELMHHISRNFYTSTNTEREYSIEIDPRTVTDDTLALLKGLGFNRISMGIQDFDPLVQQAINRVQNTTAIAHLVQLIRELGFASLSFDLIYGLPNQSAISFARTIDRVIEMAPDRIALYSYAHLPERFASQRAIERQTLPDANEKFAILDTAGRHLLNAGYEYIGMDHFVKPEDELARARQQHRLQRNFQGYSTSLAVDLIGLGPSAISRFRDSFSQNARDPAPWAQAVRAGELPIVRGLTMSTEDKLREHIIMSIACQLELDIPATERRFQFVFAEKFSECMPALRQFEQDGLVQLTPGKLRVLPQGRLLLRNICMVFDDYLSASQSTTRFSRTI
jgi:oxygen-independent coproporphyrinogen-3 oxidase